jgi:aminopeptidase N
MSKVTSSQTYQKGSWILHMLRGVVGTDNFWNGIRAYYKKYYNKNATTSDFRSAMEEASGMDLERFFEQWLYKGGALKYAGDWQYNSNKGLVEISIIQSQDDGSEFKMPLEVGIYFDGDIKPQFEQILVDERSNSFNIKVVNKPIKIVLDPNKWLLMESNFSEVNE